MAITKLNPYNFIFLSRNGQKKSKREIIRKRGNESWEGGKKKKGANPNGENRGTVVGKLPNCEAISVACLSSIAIGFTKVNGNWRIVKTIIII